MTDLELVYGPKICFIGRDGALYCTWIQRKDGTVIAPKKESGYLRIPLIGKFFRKKEDESVKLINQKEKAPVDQN